MTALELVDMLIKHGRDYNPDGQEVAEDIYATYTKWCDSEELI